MEKKKLLRRKKRKEKKKKEENYTLWTFPRPSTPLAAPLFPSINLWRCEEDGNWIHARRKRMSQWWAPRENDITRVHVEYIEVSRFPPRIFLRVGPSLPLSLGALTQLTVTQAECCTCVDMDLYRDKGSRDPNYFLLSSFVEPFRSSNPRNRASTRSTDRGWPKRSFESRENVYCRSFRFLAESKGIRTFSRNME